MSATKNKHPFFNETNFKFQGFDEPWTKLPNNILDNNMISLKAVGLYAKIVRFQNSTEHKIYISSLNTQLKEGKDAIRSAIHELMEFGYITREPIRGEKGYLVGYVYTVYATPVEITRTQPSSENTTLDNPTVDSTTRKKKIGLKENILKENIDDDDAPLEKIKKLFLDYKIQKRLMPQMITLLKGYCDKFDLEVWESIFVQASEDSVAKKYNYIKSLLEDYTADGVKTMQDLENHNKKFKDKKGTKVYPKTKKNKFDNFTSDRLGRYANEEELVNTINESQKDKFKLTEDKFTAAEVIDLNKPSTDKIQRAKTSIEFWNSLTTSEKTQVKSEVEKQGLFIPEHIKNFVDLE